MRYSGKQNISGKNQFAPNRPTYDQYVESIMKGDLQAAKRWDLDGYEIKQLSQVPLFRSEEHRNSVEEISLKDNEISDPKDIDILKDSPFTVASAHGATCVIFSASLITQIQNEQEAPCRSKRICPRGIRSYTIRATLARFL